MKVLMIYDLALKESDALIEFMKENNIETKDFLKKIINKLDSEMAEKMARFILNLKMENYLSMVVDKIMKSINSSSVPRGIKQTKRGHHVNLSKIVEPYLKLVDECNEDNFYNMAMYYFTSPKGLLLSASAKKITKGCVEYMHFMLTGLQMHEFIDPMPAIDVDTVNSAYAGKEDSEHVQDLEENHIPKLHGDCVAVPPLNDIN
jgi:hypothetical protein